jgi:flagellar biosynthetic protein FliR
VMYLFNFNIEEILTFFAVLVRYSVLFSILPVVGDRMVPGPLKILFSIMTTLMMFPFLVSSGQVQPAEAMVWGSTASGMISTLAMEVFFGLALGFSARLIFEGISVGGNLVGNYMGFASAATYDPHQESQSAIVAQIQTTMAMLIFLALNGHHLMFRATLDSYHIVGLGRATLGSSLGQRMIQMTGEVLKVGLQLSGPVAVAIFSVNVFFGVMARTMPQLNILILSMSVTTLIGFIVLFLSAPEFQGAASGVLGQIGDWMRASIVAMAVGT